MKLAKEAGIMSQQLQQSYDHYLRTQLLNCNDIIIGYGGNYNMDSLELDNQETKKVKLLIADDEDIICNRLKELGEKLGFSVHVAKNGVEGWDLFREVHPDIAVLDIYMPRMNGLLLMHKIKTSKHKCPVILITGFLHYEQLIQKDRIKPDGFIIKPFHLEKIANLLLEVVENKDAALA